MTKRKKITKGKKMNDSDILKQVCVDTIRLYCGWKTAEGNGSFKWNTERLVTQCSLEVLKRRGAMKDYGIGDKPFIVWNDDVKQLIEVLGPIDQLDVDLRR